MGCRWADLPADLKLSVTRKFSDFECLNIQTVVTVYNAFSKLDCRYRDLTTSSLRDALEKKSNIIRASAYDIKPHEVGVLVYSIARLGAEWNEISTEMQSTIVAAIMKHSFRLNEQELGNVIWGLGHMKVDLNRMSPHFRESLFKPVVKKSHELRAPALIAILQGLGRGQMYWSKMHPELRAALMRASYYQLRQHFDLNLAITLVYALGRLSAEWTLLPVKLTDVLERIMNDDAMCEMASSRVSSLINGLACMSVKLPSLNPRSKDNLLRAIDAKLLEFSRPEFSSVLWSLGRMGAKAGVSLKGALWKSMLRRLKEFAGDMTAGELAWSLWALGKIEGRLSDMDDDLQSTILKATSRSMIGMTTRERGVTFWAMARLSIPINELSMDDRNAIVRTIEELAMQSLHLRNIDRLNNTIEHSK